MLPNYTASTPTTQRTLPLPKGRFDQLPKTRAQDLVGLPHLHVTEFLSCSLQQSFRVGQGHTVIETKVDVVLVCPEVAKVFCHLLRTDPVANDVLIRPGHFRSVRVDLVEEHAQGLCKMLGLWARLSDGVLEATIGVDCPHGS